MMIPWDSGVARRQKVGGGGTNFFLEEQKKKKTDHRGVQAQDSWYCE